MSTLDTSGVPDAQLIERLVNDLFKAVPGATAFTSAPSVSNAMPVYNAPAFPGAGGASSSALPAVHVLPSSSPSSSSAVPPNVAAGIPSSSGVQLPAGGPPGGGVQVPVGAIDLLYAEDLQALLGGSTPAAASARPQQPASFSNAAAPSFYFLQTPPTAPAGVHVPSQNDAFSADHTQQPASPQATSPTSRGFDIHAIRRDFPILKEQVNGRPLVWLDNAATTQKPQSVIDRVSYFYEHENSNIHRAAHELAARATDAYEGAREKVRGFLNAASANEIVFVRGTTEAINLVAQSWGRQHIGAGDEIIVTWLEHHANIVPWQQLCAQTGAKLKVVPVDDDGQVLLGEYQKLLGPRTKLVSFTQVSNALGTITPAKAIIDMAHAAGARVLLDGAQSVSHLRADVQALGCDWFVFSGHKVFGPTGIGVLYGREDLLNATDPWQGGGNMIADVTFEKTVYQPAPARFEAGTGNIADAVGLGAAIDYVTRIGIDNIAAYEHGLLEYATHHLKQIPGLRLIGTAREKAGVLSFVLEGHKNEDVGKALNREGIAVRSGHHCAQPILRRFGLESTVRPSLALYNHCADIDALVSAVRRIEGRGPVR